MCIRDRGISVIARKQLKEDIGRMLHLAAENVEKGFLSFENRDEAELEKILDVYKRQVLLFLRNHPHVMIVCPFSSPFTINTPEATLRLQNLLKNFI